MGIWDTGVGSLLSSDILGHLGVGGNLCNNMSQIYMTPAQFIYIKVSAKWMEWALARG